ncbi:hypothetical protein ATO11_03900 [Pseudaestuariivita atlantica]|uniref:Uncharacterized protein n=2 Tax=Pseudaestuariivita atlantica TaxID=1317121 RepID=A0A0L1JS89_9RHOB|nr:hypothetical protein ATO11_03900 [Pseudaestuariivita atlantica]
MPCKGQRKTLPNFYALDYRASRVNFNLHQKRAHELADLVEREHGDKRKTLKVAICGGGIGGLTCFIALHALGFENTEIYEGGQRLLGLHLDCHHRHSHPSYNDWPEALRHLSTTDHPMMNWSAGSAHAIAEDMLADEVVAQITSEKKALIHCESPIRSIARVRRNEEDLWQISRDGDRDRRLADVVIYALGFGREQLLEGSRADSYWWDDNLENFQREIYRFKKHKLIVCGLGDGGLIDAIRIGFGPERSDMVGPGLIAAGREDGYHVPPRRPDFTDEEDLKSDWEAKVLAACRRARAPGDELLDDLAYILREAAADHPALKQRLTALKSQQHSLRGNGVLLVGDREFRGAEKMSMINVLLFGLLAARLDGVEENPDKRAKFAIGSYDEEAGVIRLEGDDGAPSEEIPLKTNLVFLRVGPKDDMNAIVEPLKNATRIKRPDDYNFQSIQDELDGTVRHKLMQGLGLLRDGDETLGAEAVEWDYRLTCIRRFAARHLDQGAQVSLQRCAENGFWVEIATPVSEGGDNRGEVAQKNRDALMALGGFDRRLFGAPVAYVDAEAGMPRFRANARTPRATGAGA